MDGPEFSSGKLCWRGLLASFALSMKRLELIAVPDFFSKADNTEKKPPGARGDSTPGLPAPPPEHRKLRPGRA